MARAELPVRRQEEEVVGAIRGAESLVLAGETGSGKTTQVPQVVLDRALAGSGRVAVTQPRRIAAVNASRQVAHERRAAMGRSVGYSVRFDDCSSSETSIKFATDGMLLREALSSSLLHSYRAVLLDEAHDRSVQSDILLGLLRRIQRQRSSSRSPLLLIVMSATLDTASFSDFLGNARTLHIPGRIFPVQLRFTSQPQEDYLEAAVTASLQIHLDEQAGDILVFLTGQDEIDAASRRLSERAARLSPHLQTLKPAQLYAALPPEQQLDAFQPAPPGIRKVVFATNIAETSVTIAGIRYVVDTGLMKQRQFHARTGVDTLLITPISKAQAKQRTGRAGREALGKCFRLYPEDAYETLKESAVPELQRSNLSSVVLQLKALGIHDVLTFDFIDPPPEEALLRSLELLYSLEALDDGGNLTRLGQRMSRFPLDPMGAKAILCSADEGCADELLAIMSVLSTETNLFVKQSATSDGEKEDDCSSVPSRFLDKDGDQLTMLNAFRSFQQTSPKERTAFCKAQRLNKRALQKAETIYEQLKRVAVQQGLSVESRTLDTAPVRRALTAGYFKHAARQQRDRSYITVSGNRVANLHPSSALFNASPRPRYIIFNEIVYTSKLFLRDAVAVDFAWFSELAPRFFAKQASNGNAQPASGEALQRRSLTADDLQGPCL